MSQQEVHPAALEVSRLLAECEVRRGRRSGPGGQHRNKVETAVVVTHLPSGVKGQASERRSQDQNRRVAIFRLRTNLALSVRRPVANSAAPSELWLSRCRRGRIAVNPAHDDFPALLAEALDVLAGRDMDVKGAAQTLKITASQLTKLLAGQPKALRQVNDRRRQLGLPPLNINRRGG